MEPTPDTTEASIDLFWLVANIFAIIHLLEDKFGLEAVEKIVTTAGAIEASMRKEAEENPSES